tara:strand:- start:144 stop:740 length:597 start_codon:yes stop_codon:yes gene_type:complete
MRLLPIRSDPEGYKIIADALNHNIDQVGIFFNRSVGMSPVAVEEVPHLMQLRNMLGVNVLNDGDVVCAAAGFYDYEPYGNRNNGKMWIVSKKEYFGIYNEIIEKLIEWGFRSCGLHKITMELRSDKSPLAKCLQYHSFVKEGELAEQIKIHGKWWGIKLYGKVFRDEVETFAESESIPIADIPKVSNDELLKLFKVKE